jgi:hypothetical protein
LVKQNKDLTQDYSWFKRSQLFLKKQETDYKETIQKLKHEVSELRWWSLTNKTAIVEYIKQIADVKAELAISVVAREAMQKQILSFNNARFVFEYIPEAWQTKRSNLELEKVF